MSDLVTDRKQLVGALADTRPGCECGPCSGEAERFIVEHVDPLTEESLANAWDKGWQSGAGDRCRDLTHPGRACAHPESAPRGCG